MIDVTTPDPALVDAVARAIYDVSPGLPHSKAIAAIHAMQPALGAAREAGRREGLEAAAKIAEHRYAAWQEGGHVAHHVVTAFQGIAYTIRRLIPAAPTPGPAVQP